MGRNAQYTDQYSRGRSRFNASSRVFYVPKIIQVGCTGQCSVASALNYRRNHLLMLRVSWISKPFWIRVRVNYSILLYLVLFDFCFQLSIPDIKLRHHGRSLRTAFSDESCRARAIAAAKVKVSVCSRDAKDKADAGGSTSLSRPTDPNSIQGFLCRRSGTFYVGKLHTVTTAVVAQLPLMETVLYPNHEQERWILVRTDMQPGP